MKIGYRDCVAGSTLVETSGTWEVGSPSSNLQTRPLADIARRADNGSTVVTTTFSEDKTIGVVMIMATNIDPTARVLSITFKDSGGSAIGSAYVFDNVPGPPHGQRPYWVPPADSQFPRHFIFVPDAAIAGVRSIVWGVSAGADAFEAGRFWAGPVWSPTLVPDTGRRLFSVKTRDDDSVLDKSDGQQGYADVKPRFRQVTCTLPWLTESDAIGTEDGETQNLQDIAFEVGKTQPIIVIPSDTTNQRIHKWGTYGTFVEPPPVDLIEDSAADADGGLAYSTQFDVIEEL